MPRVTSPCAGGLRALRAGLLATVCVSLALAAHTSAGGRAPGGLALLAATVAVGCGALLVTGRRLRPTTTVAGLTLAQGALHLWFALTSGQYCTLTGALTHAHVGAPRCASVVSAAAAPTTSAGSGAASLAMLLAHLGAVVLLGLLLARGDALLWRLAGLLWRRRPRGLDVVVLAPVRLAPLRPTARGLSRRVDTRWRRRGPPAGAATG